MISGHLTNIGTTEPGKSDDEDDVVIIGHSTTDKTVCYGRLEDAKVSAHLVPSPGNRATFLDQRNWPVIKLELRRHPGPNKIIRVIASNAQQDFGNVDAKTAFTLAALMDRYGSKLRLQARLNTRRRCSYEVPGAPTSAFYDMTINLYGPMSKAEQIGRVLSQNQIWLRTPIGVEAGTETFNPHAAGATGKGILPRTSGASSLSGSTTYYQRTVEEIKNDVMNVFDELHKAGDNLPEMEPDHRVITELLPHQKQGLYFMTEREKPKPIDDEDEKTSLWHSRIRRNGKKVYYSIITGQEEPTKPPQVLGGILADMMGLGKTLTILALILQSQQEAEQWGIRGPMAHPDASSQNPGLLQPCKSTLLVCPLSTVLNWEEQIKAHVKDGALTYYMYHGPTRTLDLNELMEYDIVITTYSILAAEMYGRGKGNSSKQSPIFYSNFFRIVLDEAHMIREQNTRQSQAACKLLAQRRWAVTGTPVQNRLDDLGQLVKFLRVKPFEKTGFAQYILAPFKSADPEILPKLRLLVDSITLRRLKDKIPLPQNEDKVVMLDFSPEEGKLYQWFARDSDQKMRIIASEDRRKIGKNYVHVLRAIMRLRLICAHGSELLSEEDLKMTVGSTLNNAIELEDEDDEKPIMTARQAYEMFMLYKETDADNCTLCHKKLSRKEDAIEEVKVEVLGHMLSCFAMVCTDCWKKELPTGVEEAHYTCPVCVPQIKHPLPIFDLTQSGIDEAEAARAYARENGKYAKIMSRYNRPHTKTKRLIEELRNSEAETAKLPKGEKPIKSVVFSGWTSHLDLIQIALTKEKFNLVRLDGKMTRAQRTASLDAFRDDDATTIILISITAGGLGLNLTSASRVYVMEPQFNPAMENQAVDRVYRLGQKRDVVTMRFIIKDSFEVRMLELQRKKKDLANLSMTRGKLDKEEAAKQRMEDLRSLFK